MKKNDGQDHNPILLVLCHHSDHRSDAATAAGSTRGMWCVDQSRGTIGAGDTNSNPTKSSAPSATNTVRIIYHQRRGRGRAALVRRQKTTHFEDDDFFIGLCCPLAKKNDPASDSGADCRNSAELLIGGPRYSVRRGRTRSPTSGEQRRLRIRTNRRMCTTIGPENNTTTTREIPGVHWAPPAWCESVGRAGPQARE